MTHNIFHLDGKGVARHLDEILNVPEIQAIQWVQGAGADQPILPWLPLIKKIQTAGKGVVVTPERDAARAHAAVLLDAGHPVLLVDNDGGPPLLRGAWLVRKTPRRTVIRMTGFAVGRDEAISA